MKSVRLEEPELIQLGADAMAPGLRRVLGWCVIAFFLLVTVGGGVIDLFWPNRLGAPTGRELVAAQAERASAKFMDGSLARVFDKDLRIRSTVRSAVLPWYAAPLYTAFADADPERLVVGKDGWIFMQGRITARAGPVETIVNLPAACIGALDRRLAAAGIKLVVLLVPRKEEVYADRFRQPIFKIRPELYPALLDAIRRAGVAAPDLLTPFRNAPKPAYLKTDSHWSQTGVAIAAEEAARAAGILVPEQQRLTRLLVGEGLMGGDLLRTQGALRPDFSGPNWVRERFVTYSTVAPTGEIVDLTKWTPEKAELGVVGTSFTRVWKLLQGLLAHFANRPCWALSELGQGPVAPLLRAAREVVRPTRVLVWEVPEYEVACAGKKFDDLAGVMALLPDVGLEVAVPLSSGSELNAHGELRIGRPKAMTSAFDSASADDDRFIQPNDGVLSVRLRGRVEGGLVNVGVHTATGSMVADWEPGRPSICLPVVGSAMGRSLHVALHAASTATLTLESIDLVTDLDGAAAVPGELPAADDIPSNRIVVKIARPVVAESRSVALVDLANVPAAAYPLTITVRGRDGPLTGASVTIPGGKGRRRHLVLVNLGGSAGAAVASVSIETAAAVPPQFVRAVAIAAPKRPRTAP